MCDQSLSNIGTQPPAHLCALAPSPSALPLPVVKTNVLPDVLDCARAALTDADLQQSSVLSERQCRIALFTDGLPISHGPPSPPVQAGRALAIGRDGHSPASVARRSLRTSKRGTFVLSAAFIAKGDSCPIFVDRVIHSC